MLDVHERVSVVYRKGLAQCGTAMIFGLSNGAQGGSTESLPLDAAAKTSLLCVALDFLPNNAQIEYTIFLAFTQLYREYSMKILRQFEVRTKFSCIVYFPIQKLQVYLENSLGIT